jgi:Arc/MetJ-type ribon-helix-helix transcriptional regulator
MKQMTFRIPDDVVEHIEGEAEERDVSKSEVVRKLLEKGMEYDDLQTKVDDLRNQLQAMSKRNDVEDRLVRYVEHDLEYHEADLLTKARWFIFGK